MNYVVVDLEWNQAMSSKSSVFNRLPIHLRGEIIEIGAVKLNDDFSLGEEFTIDVKPIYFRQMHYKVKKITGFDKDRLESGYSFIDAFEKFRSFCGDDVTFITWGCDDQGIMEQNIIIHDLDWDWISGWINLQLIYNVQTGGDKNQKSLATAMEYFGIEQTRTAHDALGDAYNTALVSTNLDMPIGLATYDDAGRILASRMTSQPQANDNQQAPNDSISHESFGDYDSKASAFMDSRINTVICEKCGLQLTGIKWINQGDGRYMNLFSCELDNQKYLARVKFHKNEGTLKLSANKLLYAATEEMCDFYKQKSNQLRKRGKIHKVRKSRPI